MRTVAFNRVKNVQSGFTIVELMIAATIFSVILLMVGGTIVRFTNTFQRGVVETSTQTVARNIVDVIAQALQNGAGAAESPGEYCIGTTRYTFKQNVMLTSDPGAYALKEETGLGESCAGTPIQTQELLSDNMRLAYFKIDRVASTTDLWTVKVRVAYGADDLLDYPDPDDDLKENPVCKSEAGFQFCAVRDLSTTVKSWL